MDPLSQLQLSIANLLLGDPALAVVPITTYKQHVITNEGEDDLGPWQIRVEGKIGLGIQVRLPSIRIVNPNVPGPQMALEQTIRIFEDPTNNNTGITAEAIGLEVLKWLDGTRFEGVTELEADTKNLALKPNYEYPDRLCYDAVFVGQLPRDYVMTRVISPTIADNGSGLISMACADGLAAIYYSTDGIVPVPGDATHAYTAPFQVPDGTIVNWYAWRTGYLPSYIQMAVIND